MPSRPPLKDSLKCPTCGVICDLQQAEPASVEPPTTAQRGGVGGYLCPQCKAVYRGPAKSHGKEG